MRTVRVLPLAVVAGALLGGPSALAADVDVVAGGLDNPRHVTVDGTGDVYVAEAGRGGPPGDDASCFDSAEGPACVGATGAVTRVRGAAGRNPHQARVVTGLASFAPESGSNAIGPHGITDAGRRIFVTNGGPTAPLREGVVVPRWVLAQENPVARRFGKVFRFRAGKGLNRDLKAIADPYALESAENPDGLVGNPLVDSNPVDVAVDRGRVVIADAGANSLLRTDPDSSLLDVLALFANRPTPNPFGGPDVPMNAVPTGVIASGSSYYVSQLTGFPFPLLGANIFKVDRRDGGAPTPILQGNFTNIIDLAMDRFGRLYVLEIFHDNLLSGSPEGALFRVTGDDVVRLDTPGELTTPGGLDIGPGGVLYISNKATSAGGGELLRFKP
jgi:hypothetical protein